MPRCSSISCNDYDSCDEKLTPVNDDPVSPKMVLFMDIDNMSHICHDASDLITLLQMHKCCTEAHIMDLVIALFNKRAVSLVKVVMDWVGKDNVDIHVCTGKGKLVFSVPTELHKEHKHEIIHYQGDDITQTTGVCFPGSLSVPENLAKISAMHHDAIARILYICKGFQSILDLPYTPSAVMLNGAKDIPYMCTNSYFGTKYNKDTAWLLDDSSFKVGGSEGPACPCTIQTPLYTHLPPKQHKQVSEVMQQTQYFPDNKYTFASCGRGLHKIVEGNELIDWTNWSDEGVTTMFQYVPAFSVIKRSKESKYIGTIEIPLETEEQAKTLDAEWAKVAGILLDKIQVNYLHKELDDEWAQLKQELLIKTGFVCDTTVKVGEKRKFSDE